MTINKVTISGPDDKVSISDLLEIQKQFPFVEWGILISRKRMGTNRYPSKNWLKKVVPDLNVSFHLCGDIVREFVAGKHNVVWEAGMYWNRVQLNFLFKEDKPYLLSLLEISETARDNPNKSIILAYNKSSQKTLDTFIQNHVSMPDNIHFLFDSSGGRGAQINSFRRPFRNYTGYAGGINPENVESIAETIIGMEWFDNVWIDMETGVRTNDEFDLGKVTKVLSICDRLMKEDAKII